jgi:hypothetical protein
MLPELKDRLGAYLGSGSSPENKLGAAHGGRDNAVLRPPSRSLELPPFQCFRVNSRIASSSPSSVNGYIRSFINSRMILVDWE